MSLSYPDLKGRTFAITGAASGMGRATALLLAKQGCNLGLLDITPPESVAAEVSKLVGDGHAVAVAVDVTDAKAVDDAFQKVFDTFGRLDGAANLAGTVGSMRYGAKDHALEEVTDEKWDQIMKVNLDGVKNCLRSEFRLMKGPGSIVNASSISGQAGNPFGTAYSSSKWAVIGLSKGAAGEVGGRGIRVNAIAPGVVVTPLIKTLGEDAMKRDLTSKVALGRVAEPEDIARVIVFLMSDEAGYISGSVINIDGGFSY